MQYRLRHTMSEQSTGESGDNEVSQEFVQMEKELNKETSVLSLMREQMKSMVGMVSMFVITIVISLFIRPWYCLLYTSPSPRDRTRSRMPSSA